MGNPGHSCGLPYHLHRWVYAQLITAQSVQTGNGTRRPSFGSGFPEPTLRYHARAKVCRAPADVLYWLRRASTRNRWVTDAGGVVGPLDLPPLCAKEGSHAFPHENSEHALHPFWCTRNETRDGMGVTEASPVSPRGKSAPDRSAGPFLRPPAPPPGAGHA